MTCVTMEKPPTLKVINSTEEKTIAEWEQLYPDLWLFLEVTKEEDYEPQRAKLIATAEDDNELTELAKTYMAKGAVTMLIHGVYTKPYPSVIG